jgi:hypothetical protein
MHPIGFAQANHILGRPVGTTEKECASLEVYRDGTYVISRWQFTDEELVELKRNGGKMYLMVQGVTMPPVCPCVMTPFAEEENKDEV